MLTNRADGPPTEKRRPGQGAAFFSNNSDLNYIGAHPSGQAIQRLSAIFGLSIPTAAVVAELALIGGGGS